MSAYVNGQHFQTTLEKINKNSKRSQRGSIFTKDSLNGSINSRSILQDTLRERENYLKTPIIVAS